MSEIPLIFPDDDLVPLLRKCDNDELSTLVEYITQKGKITSELKKTNIYKKYNPEHRCYADEIAAEIQKFGGNTLTNVVRRGKGVQYKEIVCDVADRLKVNYNKKQDVGFIETQICLKILEKSWEQMTDEEKRELLKDVSDKYKKGKIPDALPVGAFQAIIRHGGFKSYQVALKITLNVASAFAKHILKKKLSLEIMQIVAKFTTKGLKIFAGPIGWTVTTIWTVLDVASPAYRVTVPCVVHIAILRQLHLVKDKGEDLVAALATGNQEIIDAEWKKISEQQ